MTSSALHADALATLRGWQAPTPAQEVLRQEYVAHLASRPDAMTRGCLPAHLTASTLVLDRSRTRMLLTLHAKSGQWFQLGGHAEATDWTLAGVALREAIEESGLTEDQLDLQPGPVLLDAHHVPFCGPAGARHLDVMFLAVAGDDARPVVSEESIDVAWWPVSELPNDELDAFLALAQSSQGASADSSSDSAADSSSEGGGVTRAASDQPSR